MRIAVAQSRPNVGPIEQNIAGHLSLVQLALQHDAKLIVFPELSLTGYEPRLAHSLATRLDDAAFADLQNVADQNGISIAVGVPLRGERLPLISTVLFRPNAELFVYSKQHLHDDEVPFFEAGPPSRGLIYDDPRIALAICYELTVPQHIEQAIESRAEYYVASVAKTVRGVDDAFERLSKVARVNSIVTMMANCLGQLDGANCTGRSAIWDSDGNVLKELDSDCEGVLTFDCQSKEVLHASLPTAI